MHRFSLVFLFLCFAITACSPPDLQLSRADLRLADSLFLVQRNELSDQLKDSCSQVRDLVFESLVDSIKGERLREINIMLNRHEKVQ